MYFLCLRWPKIDIFCAPRNRRNVSADLQKPVELLPLSNLGSNLFLTYLRAPSTIFDIIAYLSFSAKVLFFLKFLWQNFFGARRNFILKIDACELNIFFLQNRDISTDWQCLESTDAIRWMNQPRTTKNQRFRSRAFQQK